MQIKIKLSINMFENYNLKISLEDTCLFNRVKDIVLFFEKNEPSNKIASTSTSSFAKPSFNLFI